jgi:hypothetical protein
MPTSSYLAILIDQLEEFQSTILKTQDSHAWNLQTNNPPNKYGNISQDVMPNISQTSIWKYQEM